MSGRRAVRRLSNELPETAPVLDMTAEGQGIASINGKRVFIAGAISGETVTFRRVRGRRNYDEAELIEVYNPSPDRVNPRCQYFISCGGCSLQHLTPEAQVRLKQTVLLTSLQRIGGVTPDRVLAPLMGAAWGYRRRARFAVRFVSGKGRVLVGFSEKGSSHITDMASCETLHPAASALIGPLCQLVGSLSLCKHIPQIEVAVADNATVLVFRVLESPGTRDLASLREFRERHGVRVLLQTGGPDQMTPLDDERDGGELWYELGDYGLRMTFGPTDFIQVNAGINARMIAMVMELLNVGRSTQLLDLYCGIGNFTLPLARQAGHVLGVEGDVAMLSRARHNAAINDIGNVEFRAADLRLAEAALTWTGHRFDAVLLDPPRAGAAAVLKPMADAGAGRILYVSCHPGTLARDAGTLVHELGYRLGAAGICDMFPSTSHVESVALFERR